MASPDTEKKEKIFYGWWIVLTCSLLSTYGGGIFYYGFSTFVKPVVTEFGWSMTLVSGAFSIYRLEAGIAAPIVGFLLDRIGPKKLVFIGGVIMGSGFISLSQVTTVLAFYITIIVVSIGWSACAGGSMGTPLVGKWFVKKRGKALGIYSAARGLSGVLVPIVAYLIVLYGWRSALIIMGVSSWLIVLPLSFALRQSPEKYGLLPDGERVRNNARQTHGILKTETAETDFTVGKAMLTPAFWILTICLFSHSATQSAIFVHLIPHLLDVGIEPTAAASLVTLVSLTSMFGRYGFGWLADRVNKKWLMFTLYILQPVGIFSLIRVNHMIDLIPFVLVYSTVYGGNGVVKAAIIGDYYGRKNFGTIYGAVQGLSITGSVAGPLMAGLVYDINGSYGMAFMSFAFMMVFTALLVLFLKAPGSEK